MTKLNIINKLGNVSDADTQSRTVYGTEGVSPTLAAGMSHGNTVPYIVVEEEDRNTVGPVLLGGIGDKLWGDTIRTGDRVYDSRGVGVAVTANGGGIGGRSLLYLVEEDMNNAKLKLLGNIEGSFESKNRVYDPDGLSPTIDTCGGGGHEPKIVISTNGTEISGTIRASYFKNGERNIAENVMNNRGYEGVVEQVGYLENGTGQHQSNTVYSTEGASPALTTINGGGTQQIKILEEPQVLASRRTEYGKKIRKAYEAHEIYEKRGNMTELEPRSDGVSQSITTVQKDNMVLEPQMVAMRGRNPENPSDRTPGIQTEQRLELRGSEVSNCLTSVQKDSMVLEPETVVQGGGQISPTLTGSPGICKIEKEVVDTGYRIRKLTARETWRLQGFSDEDFDKAQAVNSNTKLYQQSGNSITKNVLVAIFGQMFKGKENVYKEAV